VYRKPDGERVPIQIGNGYPSIFVECVTPMTWYPYSHFYDSWQIIHPSTKDYTVVARIGFEYPYLYFTEEYYAPLLWCQYEREHRIKNGLFVFMNEDGDPAFWNFEKNNLSIGRSHELYSFPFSICFDIKPPYEGGENICSGRFWQLCDVLPDTEYVFSTYYYGSKTPLENNRCRVVLNGYDLNNRLVGTLASSFLKYIETEEHWRYLELRFRTPTNVVKVEVAVEFLEGSRPEPGYGGGWVVCLSNLYLSEVPRNLSIHNRVMAQIEAYHSSWNWIADVYFNGKKIWENVSWDNVPLNIFEEKLPLDGIPSFRSAIRHSVQNNAFLYENTSMHSEWKSRSELLHYTRHAWGYTYDIYHPLFRASDDYPDGWWYDKQTLHDCDAWWNEPTTLTFYPYWSKLCECRALAIGPIAHGYWLNPFFRSMVAMHILNKYGDPFKYVNIGGTLLYNPLEILLTGEPNTGLKAVIDEIDPKRGWQVDPFQGLWAMYATGCCMAALAEIGYGFEKTLEDAGYGDLATRAKTYADMLAYALLKAQWGTPAFTPNNFIHSHEDFGPVSMPECTGGFLTLNLWRTPTEPKPYEGDEAIATSRTEYFAQFVDILNMPSETPQFIAVNQETTFVCVRALQIYEWYRFKEGRNRGAFPAILMPADVNGDGKVDIEDLKLVAQTIEKGEYCSFADVNGDGKVDTEDFNLVKQALRTPMKGMFWWPSTSKKMQVSVV